MAVLRLAGIFPFHCKWTPLWHLGVCFKGRRKIQPGSLAFRVGGGAQQ